MTDKLKLALILENQPAGAHMACAYVDEDGTATVELLERSDIGWKNLTDTGATKTSIDMACRYDDIVLTRMGIPDAQQIDPGLGGTAPARTSDGPSRRHDVRIHGGKQVRAIIRFLAFLAAQINELLKRKGNR